MGTDGNNWDYNPNDTPAKAFDKPTLTVVGVFKAGKLVRVEWSDDVRPIALSHRTLQACEVLGITIIDKADNYLFTGEVI